MRLFTAVLPPPEIAEELTAAVRDRLTGLPDAERLRWTEPAGWHITLAFYGETPDDQLPDLHDRLAATARVSAPFTLRLAGGEKLGDWAVGTGVAGERGALTALAAAADAAAETPGADRYPDYRPHLTLARAPRNGDSRNGSPRNGDRRNGAPVPLTLFAEALRPFTGTAWRVAELTLMRATDTTRSYARLASWPFGLPWTP